MFVNCAFFFDFSSFFKLFYIKKETTEFRLRSCLFIFYLFFFLVIPVSLFLFMVVGYTHSRLYLYCTIIRFVTPSFFFSCINPVFFLNLCDLASLPPILYQQNFVFLFHFSGEGDLISMGSKCSNLLAEWAFWKYKTYRISSHLFLVHL